MINTPAGSATGLPSGILATSVALGGLAAIYAMMRVSSSVLWWLVSSVLRIQPAPVRGEDLPSFLIGFTLFFAPLLYLLPCALARRWLPIEPSRLLLYMGATFLCATVAELVVDEAFVLALGRPAWLYQVWPVRGGFMSAAGVVMWPLYGVFVCFLHDALRANPRLRLVDNDVGKALLMGVDAMFLELAANTFTLVGFHSFYFFYLASDLRHFTTWEIFVPYVVAGGAGVALIAVLERQRHQALIGVALQLAATVLVLAMR
jgi:hypothetical protein